MRKLSGSDICALLAELISKGQVDFFYRFSDYNKCCVIGEMVFEFREEVEESFGVRYQGFEFLLMRETPGWEIIKSALACVTEDSEYAEDDYCLSVQTRVYNAACRRLSELALS